MGKIRECKQITVEPRGDAGTTFASGFTAIPGLC